MTSESYAVQGECGASPPSTTLPSFSASSPMSPSRARGTTRAPVRHLCGTSWAAGHRRDPVGCREPGPPWRSHSARPVGAGLPASTARRRRDASEVGVTERRRSMPQNSVTHGRPPDEGTSIGELPQHVQGPLDVPGQGDRIQGGKLLRQHLPLLGGEHAGGEHPLVGGLGGVVSLAGPCCRRGACSAACGRAGRSCAAGGAGRTGAAGRPKRRGSCSGRSRRGGARAGRCAARPRPGRSCDRAGRG